MDFLKTRQEKRRANKKKWMLLWLGKGDGGDWRLVRT